MANRTPAKHTPGPHEVRPNLLSTGFHIYQTAQSRHLADVMERLAGIDKQEAEANARLFAAATEMYDALKDWLYYADQTLGEFDVKGDDCDPEEALCPRCEVAGCIQRKIRNARAAIAKAEPTQ